MNRCKRCKTETENKYLCSACRRLQYRGAKCVDCGRDACGIRCQPCSVENNKKLFTERPSNIKCADCGVPIWRNRTRCGICHAKQQAEVKKKRSGLQFVRTATGRCKHCGAKITTRECIECAVASRKEIHKQLKREVDSEIGRIRKQRCDQSKYAKDAGRKSAKVSGFLHHPDIIQSAD